ncbi:MAG TPA: prefoldin subunit beta [Candidatus Nanoarchaeia archaeon]|nr:prefoldin subunit beta [Candidatus Nanoarchaeia archaeon]
MQVSKDVEQKIHQLQLLEQNMQTFLAQKQTFQVQLVEIESALSEIEKTDKVYKIVGSIMVSSGKEDLKKDLESKKEILQLRLKSVEKQEDKIKEKASALQEEVLGEMEKSK